MPSFYSGVNALPPTPPYLSAAGRTETDPSYYASAQAIYGNLRHATTKADHPDKFALPPYLTNQPSVAPGRPTSMAASSHHGRELAAPKQMLSQHPPHVGSQNPFGPVNSATMLPPIRATTTLPSMDSAIPPQYRRQEVTAHPEQQQQQQQQRPKEEKTTGGVAATLDYEMDQMADYVAEMAQGMYALYTSKLQLSDIDLIRSIHPGTTVNPQFRKYVLQILSSTRLPSSTILLGLYYLASRVKLLSSHEVYNSGTNYLYRMLTIALVLGSKFLDDNTFQNRSWSEVSSIPVKDLNSMELEWLCAFEWNIHDRIYDKKDGFITWKAHWQNWLAKANARACEAHGQLSPLDTKSQASQGLPTPMLSPDGPIPPQYQSSTWLNPRASDYSPPSAPHTGPNTPDYYQSSAPWPYNNPPPPYSRSWIFPLQYSHAPPSLPRSQPPSYHHTPNYAHTLSPPVWTGHGSSCGCVYCAKNNESYFPTMPFGLQPVAG